MAKMLWGGRFKKPVDRIFYEFQKSVQYDHKLAEYDLYHSLIHVQALRFTGVLTAAEAKKLTAGLNGLLAQVKAGTFSVDPSSEDIHTEIQNRLERKFGSVALKLHAFRSRNDMVAFDTRFYCFTHAEKVLDSLTSCMISLAHLAAKYDGQYFIGYTHTQRAQVVLFRDYVQCYNEMFKQDQRRLESFLKNHQISLGAGALAGSFIKEKDYLKAIKQFTREHPGIPVVLSRNPLYSVSRRDYIMEFLSVLTIIQANLSRLAEDMILYSTREFAFLDLPDQFCTGSSLMPHKKNPDFLELVRGYTGQVYGNLAALMVTMKALPLTYNRDMQLDKQPLFSSVEIVNAELQIMAAFLKDIKLNKPAIERVLQDETLYATEIAEFLVSQGMAFRDAHEVVGRIVRCAEDRGITLSGLSDSELKQFTPLLASRDIRRIVCPEYAVAAKRSVGR